MQEGERCPKAVAIFQVGTEAVGSYPEGTATPSGGDARKRKMPKSHGNISGGNGGGGKLPGRNGNPIWR
ncbi:hypothetical protein SAMN05192532_102373 [Alteribacillus iranensis]|uniref:Uncharacterized protein n=1 Tax=Alteribacillus iranensis TaxID=930128 RepID=A0A1I2BNP4_9BACI|nr:hypothetical protein SAMN05192532_102373 [Alteribacillus iranensis]